MCPERKLQEPGGRHPHAQVLQETGPMLLPNCHPPRCSSSPLVGLVAFGGDWGPPWSE